MSEATDLVEEAAVLEERVEGSTSLYVIFGGRGGKIAMPMFEFYQASQILEENRLFLRDLRQAWYQNGLPGISEDVEGTVAYLHEKIREIAPERLFLVGNSMGGFAAYLFATLLGHGQVIAFSPQAFISRWKRYWHKDNRWDEQIKNIYRTAGAKKRYWDINRLPEAPGVRTNLHVSSLDRLDVVHANYYRRRKNIAFNIYGEGGHGLVRHLRDTGQLAAILRNGSSS